MSKLAEYRECLELWAKWWNGPGRRAYPFGHIRPPLTKTGEILHCTICAGALPAGETCEACGRTAEERE